MEVIEATECSDADVGASAAEQTEFVDVALHGVQHCRFRPSAKTTVTVWMWMWMMVGVWMGKSDGAFNRLHILAHLCLPGEGHKCWAWAWAWAWTSPPPKAAES